MGGGRCHHQPSLSRRSPSRSLSSSSPSLSRSRCHRRVVLASVSASPAYETRGPESVPSTQRVPLTTGVLDDNHSASSSSSTQPPLLKFYRDTNAWCPFCERVWLALEAKQIPYECEFVDLRNKPKWFTDMVPT